jgi:hypothetical protein
MDYHSMCYTFLQSRLRHRSAACLKPQQIAMRAIIQFYNLRKTALASWTAAASAARRRFLKPKTHNSKLPPNLSSNK